MAYKYQNKPPKYNKLYLDKKNSKLERRMRWTSRLYRLGYRPSSNI